VSLCADQNAGATSASLERFTGANQRTRSANSNDSPNPTSYKVVTLQYLILCPALYSWARIARTRLEVNPEVAMRNASGSGHPSALELNVALISNTYPYSSGFPSALLDYDFLPTLVRLRLGQV